MIFSQAIGGNDTLDGGAGNDEIYAGDGDDSINGGGGNDQIYAGDGNDDIQIELVDISRDAEDIIDGGGDSDKLYLPGSSSDYSSQQIGWDTANKYRLYDLSLNLVATIENVEILELDDGQFNPGSLAPFGIDVIAPELVSFSIRDNTLNPGETLYIDYNATDTSGIEEFRVYFSNEQEGYYLNLSELDDDGVVEFFNDDQMFPETYNAFIYHLETKVFIL